MAGALLAPFPVCRLALVLFLLLGSSGNSGRQHAWAETPRPPADRSGEWSWPEALRRDVEYLASDTMRGRGIGTDSIDIAANYLADRFQAIGLRTDLFQGDAFQPVPIRLGARAGTAEHNHGSIQVNGEPRWSLELNENFVPLSIGAGDGTVNDLPIVFAGYGVHAPDRQYDDYAGIDVRGKAVLVLRKEPGARDPGSPFAGTQNTRHAYFQTKVIEAIRRGAAAVLIVNDRDSIDHVTGQVRSQLRAERHRLDTLKAKLRRSSTNVGDERATLRRQQRLSDQSVKSLQSELDRASRGLMGVADAGPQLSVDPDPLTVDGKPMELIPVVSISRHLAETLLRHATGRLLSDWQQLIDRVYRPQSRELDDLRLDLRVELHDGLTQSSNVLGVIDGRGDLGKQTIVVGAHYDHVGMGGEGSLAPGTFAVHNGADDNASGVATMIAVAERAVRALRNLKSHRRILFMAFTGEERGLLGSRHYVKYPRFPLESTVAMLNMDMVGRLRDNELTVYGTGSAAAFDPLVERLNSFGLDGESTSPEIAPTAFRLYKVASGYGPSDHASFYEFRVPVLFFFTGLHNNYHRPSDDVEHLNWSGMRRITDLVFGHVIELARMPQPPVYRDTSAPPRGIRRQLTVHLGISVRKGPRTIDSRGRPTDTSDRLVLSGITADSPAAAAGLQPGDTLMRLGESEITSLNGLYETLRDYSPGDALRVEVRRNGQPAVFNATLAAR